METSIPQVPGRAIELDPSLLQKTFYPGLLLLDYLRGIQPAQRNKHADRPLQLSPNLEDQFHDFVCKVALICQVAPHGDSVSSCVVLEHEGGVLYVFASNDRTPPKLEEVKNHLTSLLDMFRTMPEGEVAVDELRHRVLRKVIGIQICRIRSYLRGLLKHLPYCMRACQNDTALDEPSLYDYIVNLLEHAKRTLEPIEQDLDTSTSSVALVERFIASLTSFPQEKIQRMIRPRLLREELLLQENHWYEIGHVIARLLAYHVAVDTFIEARNTWPVLFRAFRVAYIESHEPLTKALPKKVMTAEQIVQKMASDENVRQQLLEAIRKLDIFKLDEEIAKKWKEPLDPVVHCDVLLLSWLERTEGGTHPERFFGRYKFIGTSKPPCRLCSLYIEERGTDVKFQPSHRNLYLTWLMPATWFSLGDDALLRLKQVLQRMRGKICADMLQTMKDKTAEGRVHDSTSSTAFTRQRIEMRAALEDTLGALSAVNLSNHASRAPAMTPVLEEPRTGSPSNWSVGGTYDAEEERNLVHLYEKDDIAAQSSDEEDVVLFKGRRARYAARPALST